MPSAGSVRHCPNHMHLPMLTVNSANPQHVFRLLQTSFIKLKYLFKHGAHLLVRVLLSNMQSNPIMCLTNDLCIGWTKHGLKMTAQSSFVCFKARDGLQTEGRASDRLLNATIFICLVHQAAIQLPCKC